MIDNKTLQTFLKTGGYYTGTIDGIFGPMSYAAARAALRAANVNAGLWDNARVFIALNQLFLNKVNDAGLIVDGVYGQKTSDALYIYNTTQLQTIQNFWPRQADVRAQTSMFGKPGTSQALAKMPYTLYGDYQRKIKVNEFQCHSKVKTSLERIFQRTLDYYGPTKIRTLNLDIWSGCFNYRSTVGSSSLSMHAWGIAVDMDAAHNDLNDSNTEAAFAKPVYAPFINFWEAEGWINLGRARNYDWMHFQAARL